MAVLVPRRGLLLPVFLVAILAGAVLGGASGARASSVAYIDGHEVWISSLDGKRKVRLSSGEGDWRTVTGADNGKILGVRLESGKISQLSRIKLWDKSGKVESQGPLPYTNTGWSAYAAPLGLDLSSDGIFLAYGYSGYTGIVPYASFFSGHNVVNADTKSLIQPIGQSGYKWPSMFGRRVVAASGGIVAIQEPGGGPFGTNFTGILDTSGSGLSLGRSDVAATGKLIGLELDGGASDKIGVVSISGVDPPVTVGASVDCFLPAVGDASSVSFSQDGSRVAWQDDQGVKVAGVPKTLADPCQLSSPAVLISGSGSEPSIRGTNLVAPPPADGFSVTVKVPWAGRYRVTGTVPAAKVGRKGARRLCLTGTARASKAGRLRLNLKLKPDCRRYRNRLKGVKVRLKMVKGHKTIIRQVKLR